MPMAAGGSSASMVSSYEGGERVGGKFSSRSHRRIRATPYDRPSASLGNSWISKVLVDPAKKLIASSAKTFFSSVFRKRLPPPPFTPLLPPPVAIPTEHQDPVLQNEVIQSAAADSHYVTTEDNGLPNELLQLLKHNTFTRPEVDHLTKLLESKALDLPVIDDVRRVNSSLSKPVMDFQTHDRYLNDSSMENLRERDRPYTFISSPEVLEEDITFPRELANENSMEGRRISKGSLSKVSFSDQLNMEDGDLSNDVPSLPSSKVTSLATKTSSYAYDQNRSSTTPRFRARSIIHKMASSRMHPPFHRDSGSSGKRITTPTLLKQDGEHGWKELSRKRSSAVLDDFGSVGTIRRIKRKYGWVSHNIDIPFGEKDNHCIGQPFSLTNNRSSMDDWRLKGSKLAKGVDYTHNTSTGSFHIPSKSSQSAPRVTQNLETMAPKLKLVEATKLIGDRKKTPFKLTNDMLSGKALKSIENIDFLKLLQGTQNGEKLEGSSRDMDCSTSRKQNEEIENGPEKSHLRLGFNSQKQNGSKENDHGKSHLQLDFTSPKQNETGENGPEKSHLRLDYTSQKRNEAGENSTEKTLFQVDFTSQKHNGIEEYCPEKFYRQFDTTLSTDGDHILGTSAPSDSKTLSVMPKKHAFMMSVPEDFLDLDEDDIYCNGSAAEPLLNESVENKTLLPTEGNTGPTGESNHDKGPLIETRTAPPEGITVSDSSHVSVGVDETAASPNLPLLSRQRPPSPFSLDKSKDVESPPASVLEVSQPNFSSWMQPEPLKPIRLGDAADLSLQFPESRKHEDNVSRECADAKEKPDTKSSVALSSSMSTSSSSSILSGPMQLSHKPSMASMSSGAMSTLFMPASQPSLPVVSTFTFGASDKTSTASEPIASITTNESGKEVNVMTAKSQPQDVSSESMLNNSKQSSAVGSGAVTLSQSIPFQFGSSTPFIANTASCSSSAPVTTLFGSVPSFGFSSSTSSSEIKLATSGSGSSPSTFNFGSTVSNGTAPTVFNFGTSSSSNMSSSTIFGSTLQTPKSDSFSTTFSQTPSSMFSFGALSSLNALPNNPPMPFGVSSTSTPSIFTNHDQMNGEDSMAEDPVQSSPITGFNQQPPPPSALLPSPGAGGFSFGSSSVQPVAASAFQFSGLQNSNNTFQGSGSVEFNAGGSFSLGSVGGEDKSGRKYVKVNRNRHRKK